MNSSTFSINALSDEDSVYLENVTIDLRSYVNTLHSSSRKNTVLLFPPVNNFRRFLIHQLVDGTFRKEKLSTLSVGSLYARRTVVYPSALKPMDIKCSEALPERRNIVDKKTNTLPLYRPPALRNNDRENSCQRKERKSRKPDMQIYVPRGRRLLSTCAGDESVRVDDSQNGSAGSIPKQPAAESLHTPKKKKIVSAFTSPEKQRSENCDTSSSEFDSSLDTTVKMSADDRPEENGSTVVDLLKIPDVDENSVSSKLSESLPLECVESSESRPAEANVNLSDESCSKIENEMLDVSARSDVNAVAQTETIFPSRGAEGQSSNTSLSIIHLVENKGCSAEKKKEDYQMEIISVRATSPIIVESKEESELSADEKPLCCESTSAPKVSKESSTLHVSECEWDELFDDEGEYVDKSLLNELMTAIGKVSVQHAAQDYKPFQTPDERTSDGGCVVEIHGFPAEFKTDDLFSVFASYRGDPGFQIVWVDDTHALAVFSSPTLADEVLNTELPFVKTRPIKNAIPKSRAKAQDFIQPPVSRPKTCVSLARRLVSGHLGMKINVTDQQRAAERKILSDAREKRRLVAKQKQDAWEGTPE